MITTLHEGDCLDVLPTIPEESIDSCICDPPYHLKSSKGSKKGFMDLGWDGGSVAFQKATWEAVWRVLRPGSHIAAMGGTRTYHRLACAIDDAGFEIRDSLAYLYGSGFPKSNHVLKPAWEPIVIARKPFRGSIKANMERYGTGGFYIDDARVPIVDGDFVFNFDYEGNFSPRPLNNDYKVKQTGRRENTSEGVALGRWPANVVHDGSDEVIAEFPLSGSDSSVPHYIERKIDYVGPTIGKWNKVGHSAFAFGDSGSAARFFYASKANIREREAGCSHSRKNQGVRVNIHPTVKPIELFRWIVRLLTPAGGTVLDPFLGSGTTSIASILEGRGFYGIEMNEEYVEIAARRIEWWMDCINQKGRDRSVAEILKQHP